MNPEITERVLNELLQGQKVVSQQMESDREARVQLFLKLEAFDKKLEELKRDGVNSGNTISLANFQKGIAEIKTAVEAQPKVQQTTQVKKVMLFPEIWQPGHFKIVFDTILKWIVILIVVVNLILVLWHITE